MFTFTSLPPLSLYVHIPWCVRKCPYCDFNSHEAKETIPESAYIDALIADLERELPRVWGRSIESIFFGGGTPSLFAPEHIDRLLSEIRARLPLTPGMEITLEANPGTVEQTRFEKYRAVGINRLSIGIQSFDPNLLKSLGRIHGKEEALTACKAAHNAGFDNFNLDLMFGLPGQTVDQALADITQAIALAPTHISHYQLTIEPNTLFHRRPPRLPDEDDSWEMQLQCQRALSDHGYIHYEVSAYARDGYQCQHNLNYWTFGDYLGIGAGAHSKITDAQQQSITRSWKIKHPAAYMENAATRNRIGNNDTLTPHEAGLEFMMNALRLTNGFPVALFFQHTGLPITIIEEPLEQAEKKGFIERDIKTIRPTERGRRFLNELLTLFVSNADAA
jgi:putative oxygen-independent coproporphyrinogen III oxidase